MQQLSRQHLKEDVRHNNNSLVVLTQLNDYNKSPLHLGPTVITVRMTLLQVGANEITFRTLLYLGKLSHLGPQGSRAGWLFRKKIMLTLINNLHRDSITQSQYKTARVLCNFHLCCNFVLGLHEKSTCLSQSEERNCFSCISICMYVYV